MSVSSVREVLARHGLLARRDLGQNFLIDSRLAAKLAQLAGVEAGDRVIEIGTGLGILTRALVERGARVVTIEVDAGLVRALRAEQTLPREVELLHADARRLDLAGLLPVGGRVRVVANLPYAVATPLLRRLLELRARLAGWSVTVQREVAQRIRATPGSPDYGSLAVLHALCARVEHVLDLHPRCFYPVPRVFSSFVRMTPLGASAPLAPGELAGLERVARAAFAHRRKTLLNSLRAGGLLAGPEALRHALEALGIDPRARAETLAPEAFLALSRRLDPAGPGAEERLDG